MKAVIPARAGSRWIAFEALAVQEILGQRPWTTIPYAAPETPGVLVWRGRAVAVLDIGRLLGGPAPPRSGDSASRTIVAQSRSCTLAIPVDLVREVHEVWPSQLRETGYAVPYSREEVVLPEMTLPLVDLDSVVDGVLAGEADKP